MKKTDVPLATALVGAVSSGLGTPNAGVRRFASGVLLKSKMPAAISEGFFLTSTYEYNRLTQGPDDRRQAEAQALYAGIETYFAQQR
jgi:N-acetylmuramoyl-L-alanine amidase